MTQPTLRNRSDSDESWISVSDMMAGLMIVFLFIAVIYSRDANQRSLNVTEIVNQWQDTELEIYQALHREFKNDLVAWNAEIVKESLTIRFKSPELLFKTGEAKLSNHFQRVLDDFMPRYIMLLKNRFDDEIDEIRIEGHTSSEWGNGYSQTEAFIKNMTLSQARTRSVLEYSLAIEDLRNDTFWMTKKVSANGLSSAKLVITDGAEDKRRSRRVEFTIKTKTKEALFQILDRIAPAVEKAF